MNKPGLETPASTLEHIESLNATRGAGPPPGIGMEAQIAPTTAGNADAALEFDGRGLA